MSKHDPEQYIKDCLVTASGLNIEAIQNRISDPATLDLLHAVIGMATEAGELLDMLKKHIWYGKPLDLVNVEEEMGDSNWYQSLGIHAMRLKQYYTTWEQIQKKNIAKLKVRYGDKFTEKAAQERDLKAERKILESKAKDATRGLCFRCGELLDIRGMCPNCHSSKGEESPLEVVF